MSRLRPLFHPRLVKQRLAEFVPPADFDARHQRVLKWVEAMQSGALRSLNEVQLHGEFLGLFSSVLGYLSPVGAGGDTWHVLPEHHVGGGGKTADGALGFFTATTKHVVVPIELKGARQNLDAAGSRALTPVQQAWEYAHFSPDCRFIIVSNYEQTRLYSRHRTPDEYEIFNLEDLADRDGFKRFLFLLSREHVLGAAPGARSILDDLLAASAREEEEVTHKLYAEYRALRSELYAHLKQRHSNQPDIELLRHAQTVLDRVLFVAFAEDRSLLPTGTLHHASTARNPYRNDPLWENFVGLFRAIDEGNEQVGIPRYNGGLFRADPELDALQISDEMVTRIATIGRYDFFDDVSVEVLGHIFEQSISDLEELRAQATGEAKPTTSKRKADGVFYTPPFITRYLVEETLGRTFAELWQAQLDAHRPDEQKGEKKQRAAWIAAWEAYRESIRKVRVLDPACGSGAFLVAAFDRLSREYERVNASIAELNRGQTGVFDLTKVILNDNLYGVDLNRESIEITKLSLWLKTAMRNRPLTDLDRNIKWGNSVVDDVTVDPLAFDWRTGNTVSGLLEKPKTKEAKEIDAHWREGFDVVVGNPPYVRQELLGASKEHWKATFAAYDGVADLFVYFFERGLGVLKQGGRLGFVVANKWFRAGYAEPLRRLLATKTTVERIVDFGHAPIFKDADAFPCLITLRKQAPEEASTLDMTIFPREQLGSVTVEDYVEANRYPVPQSRLGGAAWSLERAEVDALMAKIRERGVALREYAGTSPFYGVKTGFNEAFLIDTATRDRLVAEDSKSEEIIRKFLRGQDIGRWAPQWAGQWIIALASSGDRAWPWAQAANDTEAEAIFAETYPSLHRHMKPLEAKLRKRSDKGRYWWELRSCAYYEQFDQPKIVYQEIQFHPCYALDVEGYLLNNKGFFLSSSDQWLVALLNSPLLWWHNFRYLPHMKDEALSPTGVKMEALPIARPSDTHRTLAEAHVPRLAALTHADERARRALIDSLRMQFDVEKPGQKLEAPLSLSSDEFIREVVARRPKKARMSAAGLSELRALYDEVTRPMRARDDERRRLERKLSDAVNEAYGLTPEEIALMWETAPPRMPVGQG